MRVAIVGAGTMGEWFAEVTDGWLEPLFVDAEFERAAELADRYDGTARHVEELERVPVVCTAVPIPTTPSVIATVGQQAEQAVIDLSGTMAAPMKAMAEHADNRERISLHPLFAPNHAPGNIAAVVDEPGDVWSTLAERLDARGYNVFITDAETHDRAMETVQAKVHAAIIAFGLAADPVDDRFHTPISRDLRQLTDTVLSGSPHVYADIQQAFDGADDIAAAAEAIASADRETVELLYREASRRTDSE